MTYFNEQLVRIRIRLAKRQIRPYLAVTANAAVTALCRCSCSGPFKCVNIAWSHYVTVKEVLIYRQSSVKPPPKYFTKIESEKFI